MEQYRSIQIGKAVRLQMNFKHTPDSLIPVGQIVILYDELLAIKVGPQVYDVYPECNAKEFEQQLKLLEDRKIQAAIEAIEQQEKRLETLRNSLYIEHVVPLPESQPRYKWTPQGRKKVNHWER